MKLINTNSIKQYGFFYEDLSYFINSILFSVHNQLGAFAREKQYGNLIEQNSPLRIFCIRENAA